MKFESLKREEKKETLTGNEETPQKSGETMEESREWAGKILSQIEREETSLPDNEKEIAEIDASINLADTSKREVIKHDLNIEGNLATLRQEAEKKLASAKAEVARIMTSEEMNEIGENLPLVGGSLKIIEGIEGKKTTGEKIGMWKRTKKIVGGGIQLGADLAEVGEVRDGAKLALTLEKMAKKEIKNHPDRYINLGKKIIEDKENNN